MAIVDNKLFKISVGRIFEHGFFGIGICPSHSARADIATWYLSLDLAAVKRWRAFLIATFITKPNFKISGGFDFKDKVMATSISWRHFPIHGGGVPNADKRYVFERMIETISNKVMSNRKVCIHCRGGRGRSGLVVCQFLRGMGFGPKQSLTLARPWCFVPIERKIQEYFVLNAS